MKKAFTLIELLVVITIIGILAVGGIQVYNEQIKKARDSTRIQHLQILKSGSDQYFFDHGKVFELTSTRTGIAKHQENSEFLKNAFRIYVPNINNVVDPKQREQACSLPDSVNLTLCYYIYMQHLTNLNYYKVYAWLESKSNVCLKPEKCKTSEDGGPSDSVYEFGSNVEILAGDSQYTIIEK